MSDMHQSTGNIPGVNEAMLQFVPEEQRKEIMQHMGGAGAGGAQGRKVVIVDKNGAMPKLDLSRFSPIEFEDYMRQVMGQMGR